MFLPYRVQYSLLTVLLLSYQSVLSQSLLLPVEVIGPSGYTAAVRFEINDSVGINYLYLQLHRPSYRDASVNPERGAKASVRLNGGEWIALTNETVEVEEPAASYGGLGGGFHTVAMKVPVSSARAGQNTLRFRFNGTDGFTSGYRVLAFNLLRGEAPVLGDSMFVEDDPATWTAPLDKAEDIAQGKVLWDSKELRESPLVDNIQQATCGDCHARDGRDLKYFNYSNWSVEERAKFHGLTQREAEQIASYIRSLDVPSPKQARPWNPPYQPGPGLGSQPVAAWAAGAGLEAVGDDERATVEAWLGKAPKHADIEAVVDVDSAIDLTKIPLAVQFPDWNAWLPNVHPKDAWPVGQFADSSPAAAYASLTTNLKGANPAQVVRSDSYLDDINSLDLEAKRWLSIGRRDGNNSSWKTRESTTLDAVQNEFSQERAKQGMAKWVLVKYWELMQTYELEDQARSRWPGADPWQWPMTERTAHQVAPHIVADDFKAFAWNKDLLAGHYESSIWYQLQTVLNSGQGIDDEKTNVLGPTHYQYGVRLMQDLSKETLGQRWEGGRWYLNLAKMYQVHSNGNGPTKRGWMMRFVHPKMITGEEVLGNRYPDALNQYGDSLAGKVQNALVKTWVKEVNRYPIDSWERREPGFVQDGNDASLWYTVESAQDTPRELIEHDAFGPSRNWHRLRFYYMDYVYGMIPQLGQTPGVEYETVRALADWGQKMWPKGDWDKVLPEVPTSDESIVIRAQGDCGEEVMELHLDGDSVASWTVSTTISDYVYEGFTGGEVSVHFINDEFRPGQGGCEDRNLRVDYLEVCGTRYETEEVATETANCCWYDKEKLYTPGYFDFGCLGCHEASSSNVGLLVRAKGSTGAVSGSWGEGEGFEAYPNPATELLNVVGSQDYEAVLYDLVGRVTLRHTHLQGQVQIDVSHVRPGVYTLELHDAQHHYQQKIIIK